MIDTSEPTTPGWWLQRLGKKLEANRARYEMLDCYYRGQHPIEVDDPRIRSAFRRFQRKARSNFTGLVTDAVRERLHVVGFRAGGQGTTETDDDAWQVWQANQLDANSALVMGTALRLSVAYCIVGPGDVPVITGEDPRQVVHEPDPIRWRQPVAALKTYVDEIRNARVAILYLPDTIHYFRASAKSSGWLGSTWDVDEEADADMAPDGMADNELGEVPVVPFVNRPDLFGNGLGEFEDVRDIQDRINTTLLDRMIVSRYQAFRQRYATGLDTTDEQGNARQLFDAGVDLLWAVESTDTKFGDFDASDLTPILKAVEADVNHLAAITRTPPHYLIGQIVNASGDALKAAETGLVAKAKDRMVEFGEAWEQVNRIAGKYQGRDVPVDAEVIWADPESRSMAELADAAVKKQAAGVPWRQRMTDLGYTPQQIDRMEGERATDALLVAPLAQPAPAPPRPEGVPQ